MLIADGGGIVARGAAARRGREEGRQPARRIRTGRPERRGRAGSCSTGRQAPQVLLDGTVDTVLGFAFQDGRITRVFALRNPDKLHRLNEATPLSR